jgi:hypothetical protein
MRESKVLNWVTVQQLSDETGLSNWAIYKRMDRGLFRKGRDWKIVHGRRMVNVQAVNELFEKSRD